MDISYFDVESFLDGYSLKEDESIDVEMLLSKLTKKQKEVFIIKYDTRNNFSNKEIAKILGINLDSVYDRTNIVKKLYSHPAIIHKIIKKRVDEEARKKHVFAIVDEYRKKLEEIYGR